MDLSYSKKVMTHFRNPKNMGEIPGADGVATVGNPVCGDVMKMYLKISDKKIGDKKEKIIKDIKFQTLGCGAAIATSSITTQLVKGKTIAEAEKLTNEMVASELGGLPPVKMHCSLLAVEALHKAIADYQKKIS
jgi:nitrogen fixation protein NifU and related proteins